MHALPQQGRKMDGAPSAPQFALRFKVQLPAQPEPSLGFSSGGDHTLHQT